MLLRAEISFALLRQSTSFKFFPATLSLSLSLTHTHTTIYYYYRWFKLASYRVNLINCLPVSVLDSFWTGYPLRSVNAPALLLHWCQSIVRLDRHRASSSSSPTIVTSSSYRKERYFALHPQPRH